MSTIRVNGILGEVVLENRRIKQSRKFANVNGTMTSRGGRFEKMKKSELECKKNDLKRGHRSCANERNKNNFLNHIANVFFFVFFFKL